MGNPTKRSTAGWQLHKLPPQPKFEVKQLEGRLREIRFRRELYRHIDDGQILACLGINGSEKAERRSYGFLEENKKNVPVERTLESFLCKIQKEFGVADDIVKTEKPHQIMAFEKNQIGIFGNSGVGPNGYDYWGSRMGLN